MAEPLTAVPPPAKIGLPPLQAGERLDQKTFHERYEAMPPETRAELIGGMVYMPSPQKRRHNWGDPHLASWLVGYEVQTPGTDVVGHATTVLSDTSEPQPDLALRILPEYGGQTWYDENDYLHGAPELVAEVADSSESIDLGPMRQDYERAGVCEYLVVLLRRQQVRWFILRDGSFRDLAPEPDGLFRSVAFPGLWLDPQALLRHDMHRLIEVLNLGLASPEHARFVERLRRP